MSTDGSLFDGDGNELVVRTPPNMPKNLAEDNRIHSMKYDDMVLYMQQRHENPIVDVLSGSEWYTAVVYVLREMVLDDPRTSREENVLQDAAETSEDYVWPMPHNAKRPAPTANISDDRRKSKRAKLSGTASSSAGHKHTNTQNKDKPNTKVHAESVPSNRKVCWPSYTVHASAVIGQHICKIFTDNRQPQAFLGKIYNVRALIHGRQQRLPSGKLRPLDYFFLVRYNDGDREEIKLNQIHKYIIEPTHTLKLPHSSSHQQQHSPGHQDIQDTNIRRCCFAVPHSPNFWTAQEMGTMVRAVSKHEFQWLKIKEDPEFATYFSCMPTQITALSFFF